MGDIDGGIQMKWVADSDGELSGFRLLRTTGRGAAAGWAGISPFMGVSGQAFDDYRFVDESVVPGVVYHYMLALHGEEGVLAEHVTGPVAVGGRGSIRQYLPLIRRQPGSTA